MSMNLNYVAWENSAKGPTIRKPIRGEAGGRGWGAGKVQKNIRARENSLE